MRLLLGHGNCSVQTFLDSFKKTKSMAALLQERSQRQKELSREDINDVANKRGAKGGEKSLMSLAESVKRKSSLAMSSPCLLRNDEKKI